MSVDNLIDVYDFDRTIYDGDASRDFLWFCLRTQPGARRELPGQVWAAVLFGLGLLSRDRFKERSFAVMKRLASPTAVVEEFWRGHKRKLAAWYTAQRRPDDVIISASPEFLLAPIATELGVRALIATRMDATTGAIDGRNCRGEEKVRRLSAAEQDAKIDRAYSDSLSDLPLLAQAQRPYVVHRGVATPLAQFQASSGGGKRITEAALALGAAILGLIALLVTLHVVVLVLGGTVQPATTAVATVGIFAGLWLVLVGWAPRHRGAVLAALAGTLAFAVVVATVTLDVTWDGNNYHKAAVGGLSRGWNPVWQSIADFSQGAPTPWPVDAATALWTDAYPKASWIFGASVYQVTGTIEAGKALGLLLMLALFLVATGYLGRRLGLLRGTVLAGLLALNPIAINQVFSYYVDGALGCLLVVLLLLFTMLLDPGWQPPRSWRLVYWPTVAAALIVICNLKYTGLLYAGLAAIVYVGALLLRPRHNRARLTALIITGAIGAVIAIALVGAPSYVRNVVLHGNPLYPLVGADSVDIVMSNRPADFADMSRLTQFTMANLSQSINQGGLPTAPMKLPFSVSSEELLAFRAVDVRLGGYGVRFGGILLVTALVCGWLVARHARRRRDYLPLFLAPAVVTLVGVLAVDGAWWARYTPHLAAVAILAIVALFALRARVLPWLLAAVTLLNVASIGDVQIDWQVELSHRPSFVERVTSVGGCAIYTQGPFSGALYDFVDANPHLRVLTAEQFATYPAEAFASANFPDPGFQGTDRILYPQSGVLSRTVSVFGSKASPEWSGSRSARRWAGPPWRCTRPSSGGTWTFYQYQALNAVARMGLSGGPRGWRRGPRSTREQDDTVAVDLQAPCIVTARHTGSVRAYLGEV